MVLQSPSRNLKWQSSLRAIKLGWTSLVHRSLGYYVLPEARYQPDIVSSLWYRWTKLRFTWKYEDIPEKSNLMPLFWTQDVVGRDSPQTWLWVSPELQFSTLLVGPPAYFWSNLREIKYKQPSTYLPSENWSWWPVQLAPFAIEYGFLALATSDATYLLISMERSSSSLTCVILCSLKSENVCVKNSAVCTDDLSVCCLVICRRCSYAGLMPWFESHKNLNPTIINSFFFFLFCCLFFPSNSFFYLSHFTMLLWWNVCVFFSFSSLCNCDCPLLAVCY